jgi:energy-coupling factor transporter transmembrane protein EcfT
MAVNRAVFRYKKGNTVLHKTPAIIKLIALFAISALAMYVDINVLIIALPVALVTVLVFARYASLGAIDILTDMKPALYYAFSLYVISIVRNASIAVSVAASAGAASVDAANIFTPDMQYVYIALKLLFVMMVSALLFHSTSSIEIKNAICNIEYTLRRFVKRFAKNISLATPVADCVALTLNFIPEIFELWARIELSAKARVNVRGLGGKLKRLRLVLTSLLAQSMYRASLKAKVIAARAAE